MILIILKRDRRKSCAKMLENVNFKIILMNTYKPIIVHKKIDFLKGVFTIGKQRTASICLARTIKERGSHKCLKQVQTEKNNKSYK